VNQDFIGQGMNSQSGDRTFVATVDLRMNDAVNVTVLVYCCHLPTKAPYNHQSSKQLHAD
jgi:hypothetical protein